MPCVKRCTTSETCYSKCERPLFKCTFSRWPAKPKCSTCVPAGTYVYSRRPWYCYPPRAGACKSCKTCA